MPVWIPFVVERLKHFGIYLFIGAILIGGPIFLYTMAKNKGYKLGYTQSLKDHPPNVYNGTTTVNQQSCTNSTLYGLQIGRVGLGLVYKK